MRADRTNSKLTPEQVADAEGAPACIDTYAAGYQAGRLASLARFADVIVWNAVNTYSLGYRHGWYVSGRFV